MNITELNEALEGQWVIDYGQEGDVPQEGNHHSIQPHPALMQAATLMRDLYPHLVELVGAREKATEGEWKVSGNTINYDEEERSALAVVNYADDNDFITTAANTTTKIKEILEG